MIVVSLLCDAAAVYLLWLNYQFGKSLAAYDEVLKDTARILDARRDELQRLADALNRAAQDSIESLKEKR